MTFRLLAGVGPYRWLTPRKRRRNREPVPRRVVTPAPFISLNTAALRHVTEVAAVDPKQARKLLPWLWSENARTALENVDKAASAIAEDIAQKNGRHEHELVEVRARAIQITETMTTVAANYAAIAASLPMRPRLEYERFEFEPDEPVSDAVCLTQINCPPPAPVLGWLKWITIAANSVVLGLSLGIIVDAFDLSTVTDAPSQFILAVLVAFGVIAGACLGIQVGGYYLGVTWRKRLFDGKRRSAWEGAGLLLTVMFVTGIIWSEAQTERFGLLQGINAKASLHAVPVSPTATLWIATVAVLPSVASSFAVGFAKGSNGLINTLRLAERDRARDQVRRQPEFAAAAKLHREYRCLDARRQELEERAIAHERAIRHDLAQDESDGNEDREQSAFGYAMVGEAELDLLVRPDERSFGTFGWLFPSLRRRATWSPSRRWSA